MTSTKAEVWYRQYRPQRFAEIAGQQHVTRVLTRAVQQKRIAHALLFAGPRGTGKTSCARIFARAVNCLAPNRGEPCNTCRACTLLSTGNTSDLLELNAASNRGIDDIRSLQSTIGYAPHSLTYRLVILDEAHELTTQAFDALLKTLEEPPPHVIFVLCTTETERMPETIRSRCQGHIFRQLTQNDVIVHLAMIADAEQISFDPNVLTMVAQLARGSLRDAIGHLERLAVSEAFTEAQAQELLGLAPITQVYRLVDLILVKKLPEALTAYAELQDQGVDPVVLSRTMVERVRTILEAKLNPREGQDAELARRAKVRPTSTLLHILHCLGSLDLRHAYVPSTDLEVAIVESILNADQEGRRS